MAHLRASRPIDPWYVPGSASIWGIRHPLKLCSAVFCILLSVFYTSVSLSFAEWDWGLRPVIGGEGIVSKVRLRRHSSACVYTLLACLDLYRHWGSIYSDKRSLASRRHICTLYTYTDTHIHICSRKHTHIYISSSPFLTTSLVNSCPRNSAAANKHTGNWINHGIQSAPPIILNKPLGALSANFKNLQVVVKGDE